MDREASKDSADMKKRKEGERLLNYFPSFSRVPETQESGSVDILESGDLTKERHLVKGSGLPNQKSDPTGNRTCDHQPTILRAYHLG